MVILSNLSGLLGLAVATATDPARLRGAIAQGSSRVLCDNVFDHGAEEEQHQETHLEAVLEVSSGFQTGIGVALIIISIIRMILLGFVVRWRNNSALQLAQPMVLALLVGSGTLAIASCYLILPLNDTHCLLREPLVLIPLTLCGNILAGRVWRITLVMSPILQMEQARTSSCGNGCGMWLKQLILEAFTTIADFDPLPRLLLALRGCGGSGQLSQQQQQLQRRRSKTIGRGRHHRSTIRHKVTMGRLLWLVCLLTIPQLLLQFCHLAIPGLRSHYEIYEFQAYEQGASVVLSARAELHTMLGRASCKPPTGHWITWIGIVLMMVPYGLGAILSLHGTGDLPKVFDETRAVVSSIGVVALVVAVAGPAFATVDTPDGRAYLSMCMVWSIAMGPIWFLVYPKVWSILSGADGGGEKPRKLAQMLRRASIETRRNNNINVTLRRTQNNHEKSAKLALTIGKMYEDMGLVQKSITLFDDALAVWQCDPARDHKDKVGGFTMDEIQAFSPKDLEYIVQLLIAKGRVEGTFHSAVHSGQKKAAQAWLDALEIYESAPASVDMTDRSIIFPIFSGLFVFLKGGRIQQDADCNFEQNLVRKFVRETKLHGDDIHYTRALAMQCEVKARLGRYEAALESFGILQSIYDAERHSEGVAEAYGTDRSGQAFSQRALWLMQLGRMEEALDACEDVIRCLLPLMDPKNVLNMCELLLPVIRILKPRGQPLRMKQLFEEHVVQNFHKHFGKDGVTPCLPIFKPMTMLLDICHHRRNGTSFRGLEDAVEWLLSDEESCTMPDFLDSVYTKLCWSPNGMLAELYLRVASKLNDRNGTLSDVHKLLGKGLCLARKAERKMKNKDGVVTLPIAYAIHQPVVAELEQLALQLGMDDDDSLLKEDSSGRVSFASSSGPDIRQLATSYAKTHSDSSGATSSQRSSIRPSSNLRYASRAAAISGSDDSGTGVGGLGDSSSPGHRSSFLSDASCDIVPVLEEDHDNVEEGSGAIVVESIAATTEKEKLIHTHEEFLDEERPPSRSSSCGSF